MRAAVRSFSGIVFQQDYKKPTCGQKDILVEVKSAAINPVDYKINRVVGGPVAGFDFAGVIIEIGSSVLCPYKVGDEVFGATRGSLADFAKVTPDRIALKPKDLSFCDASVLNVAYMTSLQGLRDHGKLKRGGRILIIGASGGCGTSAIQIAKYIGAKDIVAVCSGRNEQFVKSLGATEVIDYTKSDLLSFYKCSEGLIDQGKKFDVIYDAASYSGAGEDYKVVSLKLLKDVGQYVAINGSLSMWLQALTIGFRGNQTLFVMNCNTKDLETLAKLADEGWTDDDGSITKLSPIISEKLPLSSEGIEKGFALLKSRRVKGKIVFEM